MSSSKALTLCPNLKLVPVNMKKYKEVSQNIRKIFYSYTDQIEPVSLDEAYLDVTDVRRYKGSATLIAKAIRDEIFSKTKLTASAGIAPNKYLAKIASDWNKPNGQYVISPSQVDAFIFSLPVCKLPGVGKVTNQKLANINITTCGQLQKVSKNELVSRFGRFGTRLYQLSRGIDETELVTNRIRKSMSVEKTFIHDLYTLEDCLKQARDIIFQLQCKIKSLNLETNICKQYVKIKFSNFIQVGMERSSNTVDDELFYDLIEQTVNRNNRPVRLIGLGVRFNDLSIQKQMQLF